MLRISLFLSYFVAIGFLQKCLGDKTGVTFTFKEYQYKDSPKNVCTKKFLFIFYY